MDIFLARQGIFNKDSNVIAYELLFRDSYKNFYNNSIDSIDATHQVIKNMMAFGIDRLVDNKMAFINCDENILMEDILTLLPKEKIVIEILEIVEPTDEVLENIGKLKRMGYRFALDDVTCVDDMLKFLRYLNYVKIDFRLTDKEERAKIASVLHKLNIKILAEKVQNQEELDEAKELGCQLFQGYYFSRPSVISGKDIEINASIVMNLLNEVSKEEYSIEKIEKIMQSDVALMYKFMKFINSSSFGFLQEITSIKQAVMLVGQEQLRKWIFIIAYVDLSKNINSEYTNVSIVRGKFCELIMNEINPKKKNDAFMVGVFSDINIILNDNIENIIQDMPVSAEIKEALKGEQNELGYVLSLAKSYEDMNAEKICSLCDKMKIHNNKLNEIYMNSVAWANELGFHKN